MPLLSRRRSKSVDPAARSSAATSSGSFHATSPRTSRDTPHPRLSQEGAPRLPPLNSHTQGNTHRVLKYDRLADVQAKLRLAQEHEAAADRALVQSRESVRAARAEIEVLEAEAREEARVAQERMGVVGRIKREGERLGRHL